MITRSDFSLIKQLVRRDLALRYRSTLLGFVWSFAQPLALIGLFYVVFEKILPIRGGIAGLPPEINYGLFIAVGITTWTFVSGALGQGANSYLIQAHLINRARFWRPVLPLAGVVSNWVHYCFAQVVLVAALNLFGGTALTWNLVWLIPLSILELLLVLGVTWMIAGLQAFARDTFQLLEIILMAAFYASPIVYPASLVVQLLRPYGVEFLVWLNPLAVMLTARHILLLDGFSNTLSEVPSSSVTPGIGLLTLALFPLTSLVVYINKKVDRGVVDRL